MVQQPGLDLEFEAADAFHAAGPLAERAAHVARRWAAHHQLPLPACKLTVRSAPAEHCGLGTGTQLELAVAAGLSCLAGLPNQSPQDLANSTQRGLRSAVGTYGFALGGLIVEQGKSAGETISSLDCRIDLPENWRFVLIRPPQPAGLSGESESAAMATLPPIPLATTERLIALVRDDLVPAAALGEFSRFADSIYEYGRESGQCFAARQGGSYNGPVLTSLVQSIRELGYSGVGQSSWGPTIFAVVSSLQAANELASELRSRPQGETLHVQIAEPCNQGARLLVDGHDWRTATLPLP